MFNPNSFIARLIMALIEENTLFTVELDSPCPISQSRNLPASLVEYVFMALFPKTFIIYSIFLLAVLTKVLSLPLPFNLKYKSNASERIGVLSSLLFSDLTNIKVIRQTSISNGGGKIQTTLNFEEIITNGDAKQNIRIYDSDIIIVRKTENSDRTFLRRAVLSNLNPKFLNVFVTGRVNIPGKTVVSKASVLSDAIDIAGGAKVLKGPITFLRFNNDGNIDKRKIAFRKNAKRGSYKNPYLRSGDLIVVGESALTNLNEVLTEFTSPLVGIFSTYGLIKAISD